MIVSCEMARMSMKSYSYFREKMINAVLVNNPYQKFIPEWAKKMGIKEEDLDVPKINIESMSKEFQRFAYFHFAPTLIYRDHYVRTRRIRWQFFFKSVGTFMILILYLWCIFKSLCIPIFKHTVNNPGSLRQFINSVLFSTVSGIICLLTLFYGILHIWFNIFGELL